MKKVVAFVLSALLVCAMSAVAFAATVDGTNRDEAIAQVKEYLADNGMEGAEVDEIVDALTNEQLTAISGAKDELTAKAEELKSDLDKATSVPEIKAIVKEVNLVLANNGVQGITITDVKVDLTTDANGKTVVKIAPAVKVNDKAPVSVEVPPVTTENEIKDDVPNETPDVDTDKNPVNNDKENPVKPAGSGNVAVLIVSALAIVSVLGLAIRKKRAIA